jgi:hypothetical protein
MVQKFVKRPVVIEALQWTGNNHNEMAEFLGGANWSTDAFNRETLTIFTLEGAMTASKGDMIIKGIRGEFYPCKLDIFDQTYELVPEKQNGNS